MTTTYSAVVQQHDEWWIGWIEEVPGVNSQGRTRDELLMKMVALTPERTTAAETPN